MEAILKSSEESIQRGIKLFQEQPVHIQAAIGSALMLTCLKLVLWRPKRIKMLGRRAVVTGAASGVGREVVKLLAEKGWRVWACDMNVSGLEELSQFPNVTRCQMDVSSADSCKKVIQDVSNDGGSLDGLVNVAGIVQQLPACGVDDERLRKIFEVNAFGPMRLCRELVPVMVRSPRGGWIVNVTSIGGKVAWLWTGGYSPTKGALNLFSDLVRRESLACKLPIRVTVIAPGPIYTPMIHNFVDNLKAYPKNNPKDLFSVGMAAEADFQDMLVKRGYGPAQVSVTPLQVAERIVNALELESPPAYEFVARLPFKLMTWAVMLLPTYWGDRILIAT